MCTLDHVNIIVSRGVYTTQKVRAENVLLAPSALAKFGPFYAHLKS